ncbi:hypothetical protein A0H81_14878 [Grifola frondosa]|uniref:Uncharacterized protein n=1 Tax=Grifola frondosa TaxID=5627 RepID=A0A1C7LK61_GRIFR|nr:hypothetical protein A0H81_14878 [Grifola frondosa]
MTPTASGSRAPPFSLPAGIWTLDSVKHMLPSRLPLALASASAPLASGLRTCKARAPFPTPTGACLCKHPTGIWTLYLFRFRWNRIINGQTLTVSPDFGAFSPIYSNCAFPVTPSSVTAAPHIALSLFTTGNIAT